MSACALWAYHNKLFMRDFLVSIGVSQSDICSLCMTEIEIRDHVSSHVHCHPTYGLCASWSWV